MDRIIEHKNHRKTYLFFGGVLSLIILGVILIKSNNSSDHYAVERENVSISVVAIAASQNYIPLNAKVRSTSVSYIDVKEGGIVEEVFAENGLTVRAGDPLLRLSNVDLQLNVIEKEARISEQISNLYNTKLSLQNTLLQNNVNIDTIEFRIKSLKPRIARREKGGLALGVSKEEIQELKSELNFNLKLLETYTNSKIENDKLRLAQSSKINDLISKLDGNLQFTRSTLSNLSIKAPKIGKLTGFDVKVGQSVIRGSRIGQIDSGEGKEIVALVDEYYLQRIYVGQEANFSILGAVGVSEVKKILPQVKEGQFEVVFSLSKTELVDVPVGLNVTGKLLLKDGASSGLVIPNGPFMLDTKGDWVFKIDAENRTAHRIKIYVKDKNPDFVYIQNGLSEGDKIITSSYREFLDFNKISIRD